MEANPKHTDASPPPPTWRRRLAIIGTIAVVHFAASMASAVAYELYDYYCCVGGLPAILMLNRVRWLMKWPAFWRIWAVFGRTGTWLDEYLIPHALNSLLWGVALYALWSLAQAVRHRRRAT